jgi:hypothetical protein
LLDLQLLRIPTYRITALAGSAFRAIISAIPFLLTLFFQVGGLLALSGVFRSIGFTAYNSVAFADIEPDRMTPANTLMSTVQELGAGLGVAIAALLVSLGGSLAGMFNLGAGAGEPYRFSFVILAVILALPAVAGLLLPRTAGDTVTGRT